VSLLTRRARPADARRIAELSGQLGYPVTAAQAAERLASLLAEPGHLVLTAQAADADVIGWLHARRCVEIGGQPFVEVLGLVVEEERRGDGVGSALLRAAEAWTGEQGITELRVRARVARDGARRFYEGRGFTLEKQQNVFKKELTPAR
jgi:GNAT superfamily N-acetyltransferase